MLYSQLRPLTMLLTTWLLMPAVHGGTNARKSVTTPGQFSSTANAIVSKTFSSPMDTSHVLFSSNTHITSATTGAYLTNVTNSSFSSESIPVATIASANSEVLPTAVPSAGQTTIDTIIKSHPLATGEYVTGNVANHSSLGKNTLVSTPVSINSGLLPTTSSIEIRAPHTNYTAEATDAHVTGIMANFSLSSKHTPVATPGLVETEMLSTTAPPASSLDSGVLSTTPPSADSVLVSSIDTFLHHTNSTAGVTVTYVTATVANTSLSRENVSVSTPTSVDSGVLSTTAPSADSLLASSLSIITLHTNSATEVAGTYVTGTVANTSSSSENIQGATPGLVDSGVLSTTAPSAGSVLASSTNIISPHANFTPVMTNLHSVVDSVLESSIEMNSLDAHFTTAKNSDSNNRNDSSICLNADADRDSDGLCFIEDSCPFDSENDADSDLICAYDICVDGIGTMALSDMCTIYVTSQITEGLCLLDGVCDACPCACANKCNTIVDICPYDSENDGDSDAICNAEDSCVLDPMNDVDFDQSCANVDSCPNDVHNDADSDRICEDMDSCPYDFYNDIDSDAICEVIAYFADPAECDLYNSTVVSASGIVGRANSGRCVEDEKCEVCPFTCALECGADACPLDPLNDVDSDNLCSDSDSCSLDSNNDIDSDSLCSDVDICPTSNINSDLDADNVCDFEDSCIADAANDIDEDNMCTVTDCQFANYTNIHGSCSSYVSGGINEGFCEVDGVCDTCLCACGVECNIFYDHDPCPLDSLNDIDSDLVCGDIDSCPLDNTNDGDSDNLCSDIDICETDRYNDIDDDNVCGDIDSCPFDASNDQDSDDLCSFDICSMKTEQNISEDVICQRYATGRSYEGQCLADGRCATCPCTCQDECTLDKCPFDPDNDMDTDGLCGDIDSCPDDSFNDIDSDALCSNEDAFPLEAYHFDIDGDNIRDNVDSCPYDGENDFDSDNICTILQCADSDYVSAYGNCGTYASDVNRGFCVMDGMCDHCSCSCGFECNVEIDSCPYDSDNDSDSDSLCGEIDSCPFDQLNDQDSDLVCSLTDSCPNDAQNDADSDLLCAGINGDTCPSDPVNDVDSDSICGNEDSCPNDALNDVDSDEICSVFDVCPHNIQNADADSDSICDDYDSCVTDANNMCTSSSQNINSLTATDSPMEIVDIVVLTLMTTFVIMTIAILLICYFVCKSSTKRKNRLAVHPHPSDVSVANVEKSKKGEIDCKDPEDPRKPGSESHVLTTLTQESTEIRPSHQTDDKLFTEESHGILKQQYIDEIHDFPPLGSSNEVAGDLTEVGSPAAFDQDFTERDDVPSNYEANDQYSDAAKKWMGERWRIPGPIRDGISNHEYGMNDSQFHLERVDYDDTFFSGESHERVRERLFEILSGVRKDKKHKRRRSSSKHSKKKKKKKKKKDMRRKSSSRP